MRPPDFSVLRQNTVHRDTPPLSPESRAGLMRRAMMLEQERIRLFTQRARETVGMRPTTSHLFDSTRNGNNGTLFAEYMANNNRAFGQRSLPGHELYAEMRLTNDRMRQINNQSFQTPRTYRPVTGRPAVGNPVASVHPSFRSKTVCSLGCQYCHIDICKRGMKAILLADTRVELYSTDSVTKGRVQLVGEDYITDNCQCKICDIACLGCGNVVGYHVTQACALCLQSCNNGHFWMFLSNTVKAEELKDDTGDNVLVWAHIPQVYKEESVSR
ncbi:FAM72 protein-domain-containing protein [Globomyces pollinis-pini]|nr:FAM72 protein-domain-containing protein [Globomyces pollinis-pini]